MNGFGNGFPDMEKAFFGMLGCGAFFAVAAVAFFILWLVK